MNTFIDFVQYVKSQSMSLTNVYFSGTINCLIISKGQYDVSFIFKSDLSVWIQVDRYEKIIMENCTVEKMKDMFDVIFKLEEECELL